MHVAVAETADAESVPWEEIQLDIESHASPCTEPAHIIHTAILTVRQIHADPEHSV